MVEVAVQDYFAAIVACVAAASWGDLLDHFQNDKIYQNSCLSVL